MRITRFMDENGDVHLGTDVSGNIARVLAGDLFKGVEPTGKKAVIARVLPPADPPAIFCIGLNYRSHAEETGMPIPKYPVVFMKNPASIIGQGMPIIIPESCKNPPQVDYEVELAVVIGKSARNVAPENALKHVAGYCVGNDVSARIWQMQGGGNQWVRGKTFDTFCPLGPCLVTPDEIPDPDHLNIECRLNGTVMQTGNTSDMIFSTAKLIAFLSEDTTLAPGTVILTGTPSGVGYSRKPPVFLKSGDLLEMTIENIGTLVNTVE